METPTGRAARPTRNATPRLSERKKQLFRSRSSMLDQIDDDCDVEDPLLGIAPLKPIHQCQATRQAQKPKNIRNLFDGQTDDNGHRLRLLSSTSSSPETNKENKSGQKTRASAVLVGTEEHLPHLFTTTMRINSSSGTSHSSSPRTPSRRRGNVVADDSNTDTDDSATGQQRKAAKRVHKEATVVTVESSPESGSTSPQSKLRKTHKECIPTLAFYSSHAGSSSAVLRKSDENTSNKVRQSQSQQRHRVSRVKAISPTSRPRLGINKGVRHNIRKPQRAAASVDIDDILSSLRNEKLRRLITTKREERAKVEEVHKILRYAKDPIKMARPLRGMGVGDANNNNSEGIGSPTTADFSDLSDDEELRANIANPVAMELEPVIPLIRHDIALDTLPKAKQPTNRKFFKSGRRSSTCMEVRITDNIRASVSQGKIALVEAPQKKQRQVRVKSATIFSAEQATVDAILRNLDDTVIDEIVESEPTASQPLAVPDVNEHVLPSDPNEKFRQQLPYQTDDPEIIEQQALLLEFLISNDICTERNFAIFIGDPENHKEEATSIVDNLYMVVRAEQLALAESEVSKTDSTINHKETAEGDNATAHIEVPDPITETEPSPVQPQGRLFPIFTHRLQPLPQKSTRRKVNLPARLMTSAIGSNQYQIDAGQKAFGARQCQQCGLVYTVHEPEEEQLHREYHDSVHMLRFKGWIDEDVVAVHPLWAADGRIIRLNERAPAARILRLKEVIRMVDKELGYSSYIVPKTFVAFFAVRKQQIVGLCLVQPLSQAHRFIQVDGTDYFSEETFEVSCGISRIWVSPLQRRRGIASKLLRAVQSHTVLGIEISRDRIAFSTPTDDGRVLARQFTQNDNFLTYDQ